MRNPRWLRALRRLLSPRNNTPITPAPEGRDRQQVREVVARLARGNVSLQSGWYQTAEDVETLKQQLAGHSFLAG